MLLKLTLQVHIFCHFCPAVSGPIYPGVCLTYFRKGKQRESEGLAASVEGTSDVQARSEGFQLLVFLEEHSFVNLHCVSVHLTLYFQILKGCCQNIKYTSNEVLLRGVPRAFMSRNYFILKDKGVPQVIKMKAFGLEGLESNFKKWKENLQQVKGL